MQANARRTAFTFPNYAGFLHSQLGNQPHPLS